MNYTIQMTATVSNPDNGFKAGLDIYVENGGSIAEVGNAIQTAVDGMKDKGAPKKVETENK